MNFDVTSNLFNFRLYGRGISLSMRVKFYVAQSRLMGLNNRTDVFRWKYKNILRLIVRFVCLADREGTCSGS